ncbi:MAG: addiction module toxin, HicA family [Chloroflexi bacterium]|nr:MAG: addiction module toxin, HicA family [Chloroflexota bacterium]
MNGLDWDKLRKVRARDLVRVLERDGCIFRRGSHRRYVHSDGRRVTRSFNQGGDTFAQRRSSIWGTIEQTSKMFHRIV